MSRLADPDCRICRGEGHLFDDPDSIVPVIGRTCECVLRAVSRESMRTRIEAANLPDRYADAAFDRFGLRNTKQLDYDDPDRGHIVVAQHVIDRKNLERTRELAETPLTDETVPFVGPYGVGKTYLACALLLEQIRRHGKTGLYITTYDYISGLLPDAVEPEERRERRSRARSVDILLLDDLGAEKNSAFAMRELWDLLHYRTSNGKATLLTSNASLSDTLQHGRDLSKLPADTREAAELAQRIFSRLAETNVPPIRWPATAGDARLTQDTAGNRRPGVREQRRNLRRDLYDDGSDA